MSVPISFHLRAASDLELLEGAHILT